MIVMHPKKENLLKTISMANSRRWGAREGSWEGAGSESRGQPRPIRWPTTRTASADRFDSVGRPGGWPWATAWTASADGADGLGRPLGRPRPTGRSAVAEAVHAYVCLRSRPIGQCGRRIRIHRLRTTAWPYDPTRLCALHIKGGLAAILRHT